MGWYPYTIVENRVRHLSAKYDVPTEMVHGLLGEFLESVHEASAKGSPTDAFKGVYFSLGDEAAWHFWSIIYLNLLGDTTVLLSDSRALWYEMALRLDSNMKRFAGILDRWTDEKECELRERELKAREPKSDTL